ncbi:hypothetical protein GGQ82_001728 [Sphingobium olei]
MSVWPGRFEGRAAVIAGGASGVAFATLIIGYANGMAD